MSENEREARHAAQVRANREKREQEREVAAARGEEHAVLYNLGLKWNAGGPEVELYGHRFDAFVAFYINDDFDEVGLVQFARCYRLTLGPPGSQSPEFGKHRLFGKGLAVYEAHRIVNSTWIGPGGRETTQHYLFAFHDEMIEAVARQLFVSSWEIPMRELMTRVAAGEINGDQGERSVSSTPALSA